MFAHVRLVCLLVALFLLTPGTGFCGEVAVVDTREALGEALKGKARVVVAGHKTRRMHGFTVFVRKDLLGEDKERTLRALELIRGQLKTIVERVPAEAVAHLRTVPLFVSPPYAGVRQRAEYHPGEKWLRENGRNPVMVKCVEFTNVAIFEKECIRMPMLVLHELSHAYHHQVVGHDHAELNAAYEKAKAGGGYDAVKNHAGKTMRAYAMSNPMEYFAENTEAFFGKNDFFPFDSAALKAHDPEMFALLERIWY